VLATSLQAMGKSGAIGDSDGWWHFRTGELILHTHRVPRRDPFSWTAHNAAWHPNAWLTDVLLAVLRRVGGLPAIAIARGAFVIAFAFALYMLARESGSLAWPAAVVAVPATLAINPFVAERPQLVSFLLLPLAIRLVRHALRGSNHALVGLVALMALWSNLHGVYVTGIVVVCAIAGGVAWHRRVFARPALIVFGSVVAGLANPFGAGSYSYALHVRSVSGPIQEWRHFHVGDPRDQVLALIAVIALAGMARTKRIRRLDIAVPVALLALATADAIRNGPLLVVVAAPEIAVALSSVRAPRLRAAFAPRKGPVAVGLLLAWVALAFGGAPNVAHAGDVDHDVFPPRAVKAIPDGCRLLNEYDLGGYVIDRRWPDVLVSQDGRNDLYGLEGENRVFAQADVVRNRKGAAAWLDRHHVNCVLAHRRRALARRLAHDPAWTPVVVDRAGVLLTRVPKAAP